MISESKNNLNLDIPDFKCDEPLGNIEPPLPNMSFYMCFVGPPRSGKTSTALALISQKNNKKKKTKSIYRGVFDNIIVVAPQTSLLSLQNNIFDDLDDEKIFNELTIDTMQEIDALISNYRQEDEQTLLYIDDMAAALKDTRLLKYFNKLISNRRHLKLSIMLITQFLKSIPLSNRRLISHLFMWKCNNKKEYANIYEELIPIDKEDFFRITKYVYDRRHNFLFIDVDNSLFYKNFNRLTIN
jgi:GTPase SAR1 family protein